jgi:tripeptidyl-peptidase I
MFFSRLLAASAFTAAALASPLAITHSVHERRGESSAWTKRDLLDRRAVLPMRVGLAQSNLDKGWEWLNEVSHPSSAKYGQHWSAKDIAEAFAPSEKTVAAVKAWLTSAGIEEERIKQSQSLTWLEFEATVDEAEELLKTKYHVYEHEETGQPHVACDEYSIPSHLKEHIDMVYPTVHFDAKIKPREPAEIAEDEVLDLEKRSGPFGKGRGKHPGFPGPWKPPGGGWRMPGHHKPTNDLATCDEYITPDCLRALYKFPVNNKANPKNSYGIVEYTPQAYVPSDLDLFFKNFSTRSVGTRPILDSIDGGVVQQTNKSFNFNGESDLDLEYAIALVYPQPVTLYQVGDLVEGASFNNFLDAIDGSYCTYEGGDDPNQDGIYPDPYSNYTGAYEGPENCGGFAATKVISTSYGYNEADLTPFYENRQCHEYMKLGMMGVSVLYSSGDYGVAGNRGQCVVSGIGTGNATYNNGSTGIFNPSFPATCPYVTAVGATQVKPNTSITHALATGTQPEEACETVIYSGGGFSNVFALPSYQAAAVHEWFADYPPPYGADRFNNSQKTRGFPDLSV